MIVDGDPEICRWLKAIPQPYGRDEALAFIASSDEAWAAGSDAQFAILDSDGMPVGAIGLHLEKDDAPSVGYWVAKSARGSGVATRAIRAVAEFAKDAVHVDRLILYAQPENIGSRRAAERAGFVEVGRTVMGDGLPRITYEFRPST